MQSEQITLAGKLIREGKLVAFPTETVYGLGADAFSVQAVEKIYSAKGRPSDNPLILHIADIETFYQLADSPPEYVDTLIKTYWPGPLTLIVKKKAHIPKWVGGHPKNQTDTIGIRMPNCGIALAVIRESGCVVAAPSANKAGKPSPTTVEHVLDDFFCKELDLIIDGGKVSVGLESTVLDTFTKTKANQPLILRPGAITATMIKQTLGLSSLTNYTNATNNSAKTCNYDKPLSPGMKYRHYAPQAPMTILTGIAQSISDHIIKEIKIENAKGNKVGILLTNNTANIFRQTLSGQVGGENCDLILLVNQLIPLGHDEVTIAQNLFACLRQFDTLGVDIIFTESVSETGLGLAIMNRMLKAAEGRIMNVP